MKLKHLVCRLVGHDHRGTNIDVLSSEPGSRYRVGQRPARPSPTCHRCGFVDENLKPPRPPPPPATPPTPAASSVVPIDAERLFVYRDVDFRVSVDLGRRAFTFHAGEFSESVSMDGCRWTTNGYSTPSFNDAAQHACLRILNRRGVKDPAEVFSEAAQSMERWSPKAA